MNINYTLTNGQEQKFEQLRRTRMNGEAAAPADQKTPEEFMYQLVQLGLSMVEQQRKQYQKNKVLKQVANAMKDPKVLADPEAILRAFGITRKPAQEQVLIQHIDSND